MQKTNDGTRLTEKSSSFPTTEVGTAAPGAAPAGEGVNSTAVAGLIPVAGLTPAGGTAEPTAEELRPELKPIAARYGREMLDFAVRLAGANAALDVLLVATRHNLALRSRTAALLEAQGWFCDELARSKGWHWDKVIECLQDVGRAARLAAPPVPGESRKEH